MFSASPDATIRIWSVPNASCVQVVRAHESSVTGLSLHATGDYLLSSSDDQVRDHDQSCMGTPCTSVPLLVSPINWGAGVSGVLRRAGCSTWSYTVPLFQYWAFSDIQTGRVLTKVTDESSGCGKGCIFTVHHDLMDKGDCGGRLMFYACVT